MPRATFPASGEEVTSVLPGGNEIFLESDVTSNESSAVTSDSSHLPVNVTGDIKKLTKRKLKQAKVYSVTTTAQGKVLRKTQWCNRCAGCLIPNCRKCVNCTDMVKYGGPGTKKKPCM